MRTTATSWARGRVVMQLLRPQLAENKDVSDFFALRLFRRLRKLPRPQVLPASQALRVTPRFGNTAGPLLALSGARSTSITSSTSSPSVSTSFPAPTCAAPSAGSTPPSGTCAASWRRSGSARRPLPLAGGHLRRLALRHRGRPRHGHRPAGLGGEVNPEWLARSRLPDQPAGELSG